MTWKPNPEADTNWTSLMAIVYFCPAAFVEIFGEPHYTHGDKTTGEYYFTDKAGNVVIVYDWKEPYGFWTCKAAREVHIGGHKPEAARSFTEWLKAQSLLITHGAMESYSWNP